MVKEKNVNTEINQEQELAKLRPRYLGLIPTAKELKVINEETKKQAIDCIRELNLLAEQFKKLRDYFLKPIEDHIKNIKKDYKPYLQEIEDIVGKDSYYGLRGQLANYETKMAETRRIEEERLRKEQEEKYKKDVAKADKKSEIAPPPPPPITVEAKKEEGVSYRDDWTYDKDNIEIEKVPEILNGVRLKTLDGKVVQKLIDAGCREIPGLKIFCKKVPIIREEKVSDL